MKVYTICGEFDIARFKALKREYEKATNQGLKAFMFEGHEYVTEFAKYLIEFLTNAFKK